MILKVLLILTRLVSVLAAIVFWILWCWGAVGPYPFAYSIVVIYALIARDILVDSYNKSNKAL